MEPIVDIILIEGLTVNTVIGCFAWEREIIQPLLLDLKVTYDLSHAAQSDELIHTINYAEICEISASVIQDKQPKLIEHAAQLVIDALFSQFEGIEKLTITIRKPAIIPQAQSVGICIERQRNDIRTVASK